MCILLLEVMEWNCDGNAAQFVKCETNSKRGCSEVFVPDLNRILVVQNKTPCCSQYNMTLETTLYHINRKRRSCKPTGLATYTVPEKLRSLEFGFILIGLSLKLQRESTRGSSFLISLSLSLILHDLPVQEFKSSSIITSIIYIQSMDEDPN